MRRWIPAVATAVALTVVSGLAGAQDDLLRDPVSFPDVLPGNNNIDYDSIDYAVRRGWFAGHSDGTFDPLGRLTSTHLVRVIERAFPDGMTRGEFAALLTGGEWAAELTPGRRPTNPIPFGQTWRVGDWDIRLLELWPSNGYAELQNRGYNRSYWWSPYQGRELTIIEVEVVYRGTQPKATWNNSYTIASDRKNYESGCKSSFGEYSQMDGHLVRTARDIKPGIPVRGLLCRSTDHGDNPNRMQISKESNWAWFSLTGRAGGQDDLLRDPVEFLDIESSSIANIDYAVRRGWFEGKADGRFDPLGQLTSAQLVRVIDRAFPDGMRRGEFAALLTGGEWTAGLTPGKKTTNPIPYGQIWRVGDWDIRLLELWPQNGYAELANRGYDRGSWVKSTGQGTELTIIEVEAVYRGTQPKATWNNGYTIASDRKNYESGCRGRKSWHSYSQMDGYLARTAQDIKPGGSVRGLLCRITDYGDNPNRMQIWEESNWAWFEL